MKNDIAKYIENSNTRNSEVFWYNYNKFKGKVISMFEWINLPSSIDERYLEMMLCDQGYVCFFKTDVTGVDKSNIPLDGEYLALQCTLGGRFNVYSLPTYYNIVTASGFQARRTMADSVIIYNNYMHTPSVPMLMYHAQRISNIERTIEINLNQLKRPYIFLVPEKQRLTILKMFRDIKDNQDLIIGDKNLDLDSFQLQNTITPNNTNDLYTLKKRYYNEALTDIGINNLSSDKKERLVSEEVSSNEEDIYINRMNMLNARKQACAQINKMFGLNIDVKFRYDTMEEQEFDIDNAIEGGEE